MDTGDPTGPSRDTTMVTKDTASAVTVQCPGHAGSTNVHATAIITRVTVDAMIRSPGTPVPATDRNTTTIITTMAAAVVTVSARKRESGTIAKKIEVLRRSVIQGTGTANVRPTNRMNPSPSVRLMKTASEVF